MTHLRSHQALPGGLADYYNEVNEQAERDGVHPGDVGITVPDADLDQARALAALGAADLDEGTRTLRLKGEPAEEEDDDHGPGHGDRRAAVLAKDSGFAGQGTTE